MWEGPRGLNMTHYNIGKFPNFAAELVRYRVTR